jgi:hypothetical protein
MSAVPRVYREPLDIEVRLHELGLRLDVVQDVRLSGRVGWATCTENDPPGHAGMHRYAVMTRELRNILMPEGWLKTDISNHSMILSPDRSVAIVVASGNELTGSGDEQHSPSTKYPKGPLTAAAVDQNRQQLDLFPEMLPIGPTEETLTWVLLVRYGAEGDRAELSLPSRIDDDGWISDWRERIILPVIAWDGGGAGARRRVPEPLPDFDIDVIRRTS